MVPAGIVTGPASAEALVFSDGEGAAEEAREASPPDAGVDVAAGWPAGAGSLLELGLFPQPVDNIERLAIKGKTNLFEFLGITRFSPGPKRNSSRTGCWHNAKWQIIVIGSNSNRLVSASIPHKFRPLTSAAARFCFVGTSGKYSGCTSLAAGAF